MRLKIRCDGESEKFYKFFWELNKAQVEREIETTFKVKNRNNPQKRKNQAQR